MKRRTKKRALVSPDLTPLIDVVFLLLIFFMLVTTFDKYSGFSLELPQGNISSNLNTEIPELIIDTDENYFLLVNNIQNKIDLENLTNLDNVNEIIISADKNLRYEVIVKAIGKLKNIGVEKVELNFYE